MGALARGRILLFALYVPSRLYALTALPLFLDETLHVRWAREIAEGRRPWSRPWQWGRALTVWAGALVTPLANDLAWANRAVSVATCARGVPVRLDVHSPHGAHAASSNAQP